TGVTLDARKGFLPSGRAAPLNPDFFRELPARRGHNPGMKSWLTLPAAIFVIVAGSSSSAAELVVPAGVVFERDIEYANPEGQHLQLNLARPQRATGAMPVVLCIHGGGFRAGKREGYDALC